MIDNFAIQGGIQQLPKLRPQKFSEFSHYLYIFYAIIFIRFVFFINVSLDDKIVKSTKVASVLLSHYWLKKTG